MDGKIGFATTKAEWVLLDIIGINMHFPGIVYNNTLMHQSEKQVQYIINIQSDEGN